MIALENIQTAFDGEAERLGLKTEEDVILFLEEALAENDPVLWQHCLGDAARSVGMAKIAEKQAKYSAN